MKCLQHDPLMHAAVAPLHELPVAPQTQAPLIQESTEAPVQASTDVEHLQTPVPPFAEESQ